MSKIINAPKPIVLKNPNNGEALESDPVDLRKFIKVALMQDRCWGADLPRLRAASAIMDAVDRSNGTLELRVEDWEKLAEVAKKPTDGYQGWAPIMLPQLLPFIEAIVGAQDKLV